MRDYLLIVSLFLLQTHAFSPATSAKSSRIHTSLASTMVPAIGVGTGSGSGDSIRKSVDVPSVADIWKNSKARKVQGRTLKTWTFSDESVERVKVLMKTQGRPLRAEVYLWQGPDNVPQTLDVYVEDAGKNGRTFSCVFLTPMDSNAIAIRNTAAMEFPLYAVVEEDTVQNKFGMAKLVDAIENVNERLIQGGAVHTYPFDPSVQSVQVMLKTTDGRPLNARVELLQGPNNNKQVMEIYTEDGIERPFFVVIDTPGTGNVVRIVNTATIEFPLTARVEPFEVMPLPSMSFSAPKP